MKNIIITVVVIVVLGFVILFIAGDSTITDDINENSEVEVEVTENEINVEEDASVEEDIENPVDMGLQNIVTYTASGFSPRELTVNIGDIVTFINESSQGMWIASDSHPTHRNYSGTSLNEHCVGETSETFDACHSFSSGESWNFTFDQLGEWDYHNHVRVRDVGMIMVQ